MRIKLQRMQEISRLKMLRVHGEHEDEGTMRTEAVAVDWMTLLRLNEMDD